MSTALSDPDGTALQDVHEHDRTDPERPRQFEEQFFSRLQGRVADDRDPVAVHAVDADVLHQTEDPVRVLGDDESAGAAAFRHRSAGAPPLKSATNMPRQLFSKLQPRIDGKLRKTADGARGA